MWLLCQCAPPGFSPPAPFLSFLSQYHTCMWISSGTCLRYTRLYQTILVQGKQRASPLLFSSENNDFLVRHVSLISPVFFFVPCIVSIPLSNFVTILIISLPHCPSAALSYSLTAYLPYCLAVPLPHCLLSHCPSCCLTALQPRWSRQQSRAV